MRLSTSAERSSSTTLCKLSAENVCRKRTVDNMNKIKCTTGTTSCVDGALKTECKLRNWPSGGSGQLWCHYIIKALLKASRLLASTIVTSTVLSHLKEIFTQSVKTPWTGRGFFWAQIPTVHTTKKFTRVIKNYFKQILISLMIFKKVVFIKE